MFHFRWACDVDQFACAGRIARGMMPGASDEQHAAMSAQIRERMVSRVFFVGSNEKTAKQIESSLREALGILDAHLATRPYLFGARPAFADLGLFAQLYEAWTDPTVGALVEGRARNVLAWVHRMLWPRAEGEFEPWSALEPTLLPLLQRSVGALFLPETAGRRGRGAAGEQEFRRAPPVAGSAASANRDHAVEPGKFE